MKNKFIRAIFALALVTAGCGEGGILDLTPGSTENESIGPSYVYVETNDIDGNEILRFSRADNGTLSFDGKVDAKGEGIDAGADQNLGPLDSDQNLILSEDGRYLFAVNSGSHSIAVFMTSENGNLAPVAGSPFPSGGANPVSLAIVDNTLYVLNKASNGIENPNYAIHRINGEGQLSILDTVEISQGGSPAIAYVTPNERHLFGTYFMDSDRLDRVPVGQIDSFRIGTDTLISVPGSPFALPTDTSGIVPPPPAVALNLIAHPTDQILYVGFPTRNQLGVYTYDDSGDIDFIRTAPNSGKAICWFLINDEGTRLYSVNSVSGSLSVYDITDPLDPVEISAITLRNAASGRPFVDDLGQTQEVTSQPFQLAFGPGEDQIYVISQRATTNADDSAGNYLHTLDVNSDGTLREASDPIDLRTLGVSAEARPQGVVVFTFQQ